MNNHPWFTPKRRMLSDSCSSSNRRVKQSHASLLGGISLPQSLHVNGCPPQSRNSYTSVRRPELHCRSANISCRPPRLVADQKRDGHGANIFWAEPHGVID